jgi:hypothetical protein
MLVRTAVQDWIAELMLKDIALVNEDIRYKSLHKREIVSIVQLNRSKRYSPQCKLCGDVVCFVQILVLCVRKEKFRGFLRFL